MPLHLEIVTAERLVLSDDVDQVNVPTLDGRVGILPRHEPLMTVIEPGELSVIRSGEREEFAISGGFMEVLPTRVTILADTVERAEEIDEARADTARRLAEEQISQHKSDQEMALAEAALRRALIRLKVANLKKGGRRAGPQ